MKSLLFVSFVMAAAASSLLGQAGQPDPHSNVFLGGDKPKKEKAPTSRSVRGTVTDDSGRPLENAVVTLTNQGTHERLSYFTKKDGLYYFDGLSFTTDYNLVAQYKDGKSIVKTLSQYDRSPRIVRILEIDKAARPDSRPAA